ncbi:MAG: hypothetical protein ACI358_05530 [Candidatus Limimorpha sp.]
MTKTLITILLIFISNIIYAQSDKEQSKKTEIVKQGWNFCPLPVLGFNSDLGFQYGACVDIINFGDGAKYPDYNLKMNVEVSTYTKGSSIFRFYSFWNNIIPKGRIFIDVGYFIDKKFDFFGYNGYSSPYFQNIALINNGIDENGITDITIDNSGEMRGGFNFFNRNQFRAIASLQKNMFDIKNLYFGFGLAYYKYDIKRIGISKYDNQITLYDLYCESGLITEEERDGGNIGQVKAGIIYDSKNYDNDPTRGVYFEGTFAAAPDIFDREGHGHITFTGVFHHYMPLHGDRLTFCYRLGVQNVLGGEIPFYAMMNTNTLFFKKLNTEAFGGASTGRGLNRNGVVGKGIAWANIELRWRLLDFKFLNQNWMAAITPMFDAGMVTQHFRIEQQKEAMALLETKYNFSGTEQTPDIIYSGKGESLHCAAGCGIKLIMNRNVVISADFAKAFNPNDGKSLKSYIGFNYIF